MRSARRRPRARPRRSGRRRWPGSRRRSGRCSSRASRGSCRSCGSRQGRRSRPRPGGLKRTPCVRQRSTSVCWEYWKNRLRSETSGIVAVSICSASPVMWLLSHTTSLSARPALLAAEKPIRLGRTNGGPGSGARPIFRAAARGCYRLCCRPNGFSTHCSRAAHPETVKKSAFGRDDRRAAVCGALIHCNVACSR